MKIKVSIIILIVVLVTGQAAQAASGNYLYPSNKEKVFTETVDQFYDALRNRSYPVHQEYYRKHYEFYKKYKNKFGSMDTALFKDMPDASVNFRKKVLFREVEKFQYITWDGNGILTAYPDIQIRYNQAVSPDRQVYFFYSFKDTDKEFRGRCAVYDVETKRLVAGGETHIDKYPREKPIHQYLSKSYGINNHFNILYADNNWLEGVDHQTDVELEKPYHTYLYLIVSRDTLKVDKNASEDVFLQTMTGAYIEQHPVIIQVMRELINKYGLDKYPEKFKQNEENIFPYNFIQFNIDSKQQKYLEEEFKKTQKIDTISLLPTLKPNNNPPTRVSGHLAVVNFVFTFDINKHKRPIPKAEELVTEFESRGVLTEGYYNVWVQVKGSPGIGGDLDTLVVFKVDKSGKYTIISKPNPDDI